MHVNIDPHLLLGVALHTLHGLIHRVTVLQFFTTDPAPKTTVFLDFGEIPFPMGSSVSATYSTVLLSSAPLPHLQRDEALLNFIKYIRTFY